MKIDIVNKSNNSLPTYAHTPVNNKVLDSGMDVYGDFHKINKDFMFDTNLIITYEDGKEVLVLEIQPLGRVLIPTGISVACPNGYEIQCRDKSGLALKQGLILTNGIGTIDSIYRGDIGIIITNISNKPAYIKDHTKIAQLVCMKVEAVEWNEVKELDDTNRGNGGYGSTGLQ